MSSSPGPTSSGGSCTYVVPLTFAWKYARFTSATINRSPLLPDVSAESSSFITSRGGVAANRPSNFFRAISRATFLERYLWFT